MSRALYAAKGAANKLARERRELIDMLKQANGVLSDICEGYDSCWRMEDVAAAHAEINALLAKLGVPYGST